MLAWILENSIVAVVFAVAALLVCRLNKSRPAVCHLLWLTALVVLVNAVIYGWLMIRSSPAALRRARRRVDTKPAKAATPARRR